MIKEFIGKRKEMGIIDEWFGESEFDKIDVNTLKRGYGGASFHGEDWVNCPYCCKGAVETHNLPEKDGWFIAECPKCGKYFKIK